MQSTHVRLLEPVDPEPNPCPFCAQVDEPRLQSVNDSIASLLEPVRTIQESMHRLQRALRSVVAEQRKLQAELASLSTAHPRCAVCRRPVGPGHPSGDTLLPESHGSAMVCYDCKNQLHAAKLSATAQLQAWWQSDAEEEAESHIHGR